MLQSNLKKIQKRIDRLQAQLLNKEKILVTIAPEEKVRIKQQIRDLKESIKEAELEYWQFLSIEMENILIKDSHKLDTILSEIMSISSCLKEEHHKSIYECLLRMSHEASRTEITAKVKIERIAKTIPVLIKLIHEFNLDPKYFFAKNFPEFAKWIEEYLEKSIGINLQNKKNTGILLAKRNYSQIKLLKVVISEVQSRIDQTLHNSMFLNLKIERQDHWIQHPWSTISMTGSSTTGLSKDSRIIDIFNHSEIDRHLLILGEAGTGKTTIMLDLARSLVEHAIVSEAEPIPVLLSLSSWKKSKKSFFDWLINELKEKYGIRHDLSKQWIEENSLLPLLDGLDEVNPLQQKSCALAINRWLTGDLVQRPCGVLICCRREEFEKAIDCPLFLNGAICIEKLTVAQIKNYLTYIEMDNICLDIDRDRSLIKILNIPLFLSMFSFIKTEDESILCEWDTIKSADAKIDYLINAFLKTAMKRQLVTVPAKIQQGILSKSYGRKKPPSNLDSFRYLIFIAKGMSKSDETEFLIERVDRKWLLNNKQVWEYRLICGSSISVVFGLINFFLFDWVIAITFGTLFGLLGGLLGIFDTIKIVEKLSISRSILRQKNIAKKISDNLKFGFLIGLFIGAINALFFDLNYCIIVGIITGSIVAVERGLISLMKKDLQEQVVANQGIKNTFSNMLLLGAVTSVIGYPFKLLLESILIRVDVDVDIIPRIVTSGLLCLIYFSFLEGGGKGLIQHTALRITMILNGYAPFRYDLFLNYCTERLILQRIGGRYRFMHKILQDYFARTKINSIAALDDLTKCGK